MVRGFAGILLSATLAWSGVVTAADAEQTRRQQGLDEQVQQLKEEVLQIDQELKRLEERLVYPSSSQVALFLSLEPAPDFSLDSIKVRLDEQPFTSHIYSYRELEALRDGGVQRLRVANVTAGPHRLEVTIAGATAADDEFEVSQRFRFEKTAGPRLIELRVTDTGGREPTIEIHRRQ